MEEVIGNCRKLRNEIIFTIVWGMRWVGHVACMREKINTCRVLMGNQKERCHLEDLGIAGRKRKIFIKVQGEEENEGPL
jgi:hypothetical protein